MSSTAGNLNPLRIESQFRIAAGIHIDYPHPFEERCVPAIQNQQCKKSRSSMEGMMLQHSISTAFLGLKSNRSKESLESCPESVSRASTSRFDWHWDGLQLQPISQHKSLWCSATQLDTAAMLTLLADASCASTIVAASLFLFGLCHLFAGWCDNCWYTLIIPFTIRPRYFCLDIQIHVCLGMV